MEYIAELFCIHSDFSLTSSLTNDFSLFPTTTFSCIQILCLSRKTRIQYSLGTVNSKSFVSKDLLRSKWKYELTVHFKHEVIGKHLTETSNKVELRINLARSVIGISSFSALLPPANEVWGKVIFLHVCVILSTGGACMVVRGVHGGCQGDMRGCLGGHVWLLVGHVWLWGACVVAGGHAWLQGGVHGCGGCAWLRGCVVAEGGICGCGGCLWLPGGA